MDTSILDNLGNLGNLDNLVNLESLGSPSPGLITGLVLVASVLGLVLAIALIVFCIFYLFKFDALKDWVNDLADGEEIVEHRLSFSMLRPILATFVITGGCLAVAVLAPETHRNRHWKSMFYKLSTRFYTQECKVGCFRIIYDYKGRV